ncbi:nitrate- and nitrite sensing domain-containing protein [Actinoplanes sp. NEAU-A12]|uniref:histidine kinase n=1 Tax=Actinoplanes sandaracinus TaxID=3045177 RepID=A0ABT6WQG0_9ACTN|nr:nitrate- and nitrite sensing domain-containing protein [Actinoplanes sandaracinus]MDI6101959.1 nitrate- and nitrite sensing domain-containing protein [Actinoplanes sandaracinus]
MRSRNWSIRSKIIAMVAVPLTALLALWIFATSVTAGPALNLLSARDAVAKLGDPGMRLISQLQRERHYSAIYQATTRPAKTELSRERDVTDELVAELSRAAGDADANADVMRRVGDLFTEVDKLGAIRQEVDDRKISYFYIVQKYDGIIDAAFEVSRTAAVFFHERVDRETRGLISAFEGLEYLSRIDALLAGANANGRIDAETRRTLIEYVSIQRYLLASGVADMPQESQGDYAALITHPDFVQLDIHMNKLFAQSYAGGPPPVSGIDWQPAYNDVSQELRKFTERTVEEVAEDATPLAIEIIARLILAAVLGMLALGLSVYVSIRLGRSIVGRLIRLRRDALELASERLPSVVRRLQRGEMVDVDVETPPLEYGKDEIGQLGHAFNDVQRTAVRSAVEEANVRRGINEVFLNIARRSQTLLHRQLSLLDKMERRETDPRELEDLYRVDHLATRMRRHAEDLVILAGAAPGRGWRNPVPVIDVVRGAISEVEDYKRVDIRTIATAALVGRSVGDVIHLLAELIENAASFSPPHTRVQVIGQVLPNGYAVEIEDRGLGMTAEALEETNRRLVEPPDFDPADSARLGLFVVAQLANRHNIRVSLRASAYGGVTAVVLIPGDLMSSGAGGRGPSGALTGPLVGSGADDPARNSLAALQWPGSGELRQVTATGRRSVLDDAPAPAGAGTPPVNGHHRAAPELTGPAPSVVAAELSAEGLVQRRRVRKPAVPPPAVNGSATAEADKTVDLSTLDELAAGLPVAPRAVPRGSGPAAPMPVAEPVAETPLVETPLVETPKPEVGEDGLPRRVRQANLAPQLRQPVVDVESTAPVRSPEKVRSLMSALQLGTRRGRADAAREGSTDSGSSVVGHAVEPDGVTSSDADTVSFPSAVHAAATGQKAPSGPEAGVNGEHADGPGENLMLEKDA